jgi:Tol biopolymer transport system component
MNPAPCLSLGKISPRFPWRCALLLGTAFLASTALADQKEVGSAPFRASVTGAGNSHAPIFSGDGRHVAFVSHANNLVTNDDFGPHLDLFLRDLISSNTTLVSVSSNGIGGANDNLALYSLSSNAQLVAFETAASNLVTGDTNRVSDIYVRDVVAGVTRLVSVNAAGSGSANGPSSSPLISEDGHYLIFESLASNLVTNDFNGTNDIFIRDLVTGTTALVSVNADGTASPDGSSHSPSISADGLMVAFVSHATNLVGGISILQNGVNLLQVPTNQLGEIYVRDVRSASNVWAVASYLYSTLQVLPAPIYRRYQASVPAISEDGRYVGFQTAVSVVRFDLHEPPNNVIQFFSPPPGSSASNAFSFQNNPRVIAVPKGLTSSPLLMTPDGRHLVYTASNNTSVETAVVGVDFGTLLTNNGTWCCDGGQGSYTTNVYSPTLLVSTNLTASHLGTQLYRSVYNRGLSVSRDAARITFSAGTQPSAASGLLGAPAGIYLREITNNYSVLVTTNLLGRPGADLGSVFSAATPDGSLIAWDSPDENLVADDLNRAWDVFVRNVDTGETHLVSARHPSLPASSGLALSRLDLNPGSISGNGQRIAVLSLDNTLAPNDTNSWRDLFVRDLVTGSNIVASSNIKTIGLNPPMMLPGSNAVTAPFLSADGRFIVFAGEAPLFGRTIYWRDLLAPTNRIVVADNQNSLTRVSLPVLSSTGHLVAFDSAGVHDPNFIDVNNQSDVFVHLLTPHPSVDCVIDPAIVAPAFVSAAWSTGTTANGASVNPAFSPDSAWILFQSAAGNLLEQPFPIQSRPQLYARSVWITNYVGAGCGGQDEVLAYSPTKLLSYSTIGSSKPDGISSEDLLPGGGANPRFSADSRFVGFESYPNIIYRHDLHGGYVTKVTEIDGVPYTNRARLTNDLVCTNCASPTLNSDGRFIAYESRPAIGEPANVYVKDLQSGREELVSVSLTGTNGNGLSSSPLLSYDARHIVFASKASDLVANDTNRSTDIFVRDRLAGVTHCLSANFAGTATGNRVSSNPVLSADGRTAAFQSFASDLVPGDYNDTRDVLIVTLGGPDTDGDGMDDDWEMAYFSTLSREGAGDFDEDGASDLAEFKAATNPANDASILRVLSISSNFHRSGQLQRITLLWSAVPGKNYRVQYRDFFLDVPWTDLAEDVIATSTTASKVDSVSYLYEPSDAGTKWRRFYRVLLVQ